MKAQGEFIRSSLKWGLVGCGWVARDYVAPALLAAPSARLVALCDPNAQSLTRISELAPDASTYAQLDAFLAHPELDAVYIATPNHLHRPLCEAAAQRGKHVLCEKPMATTFADANAMVEACRAANVVYATAFDQRFHAYHQAMRELIVSGEVGTITAIRIHYACWTPTDWVPPTQTDHDNWRIDPKRAGGGAFMDLAPHGLDLSQYLLGEPLAEVACFFQRRIFDYAVDDGAALIGRFENGALLSHNIAYNCPDAFPRRTLEVIGTKAMLVARNTMGQTPGGSLQFISAQDGSAREIEVEAAKDVSPFQNQVEAFSRCLVSGETFPFSPAADLRTMHLLESAQQRALASLDATGKNFGAET